MLYSDKYSDVETESENDAGLARDLRQDSSIHSSTTEPTKPRQDEEDEYDSEVRLRVRRSSVLVVEDSPDARAILARYIREAGGEVDFAENGLEGLKKALSANYDVVLMDIQMPRIDGLDAIRKLRGWGYEGSVVAITGHSRDAERDECLRAGFDEYMTKPVDRARLLYTVACQPRRRATSLVH